MQVALKKSPPQRTVGSLGFLFIKKDILILDFILRINDIIVIGGVTGTGFA